MQYLLVMVLIILTLVFILGLARALRMSRISVSLIEKYAGDRNNPALVEEIFKAVSADIWLGRIMRRHNATVEDIRLIHGKLMEWGDFRKYNRYVPVTSFFNVTTLEYLLEHKGDDAKALTAKMMNHFHI